MTTTVDDAKLHAFWEQMLGDLGAAANTPLMLPGDELGLSKALAERTGTAERWVREWLAAQATSGGRPRPPSTSSSKPGRSRRSLAEADCPFRGDPPPARCIPPVAPPLTAS